MPPQFDLFVGIDWSGAKGERHRGIAVAQCGPGHGVPTKVAPPDGKSAWSRQDVADWLLAQASDSRVFAGIDFAFAHPFLDEGAYYSGIDKAPDTPRDLWQMIDEANLDKPDLYGGGLWASDTYGPFYNAPGQRGALFSSRRRQTEIAAATVRSPSPTFNCVGPAGVGTGSLAGMRFLHALRDTAAIWPFDPVPQDGLASEVDNDEMWDNAHDAEIHSSTSVRGSAFKADMSSHKRTGSKRLTLAEIFPSYYFSMAGLKPIKGAHGEAAFLNQALAYFGSQPVADNYKATGPDADLSDAIISAAALRALSQNPKAWLAGAGADKEGWIFGVMA